MLQKLPFSKNATVYERKNSSCLFAKRTVALIPTHRTHNTLRVGRSWKVTCLDLGRKNVQNIQQNLPIKINFKYGEEGTRFRKRKEASQLGDCCFPVLLMATGLSTWQRLLNTINVACTLTLVCRAKEQNLQTLLHATVKNVRTSGRICNR